MGELRYKDATICYENGSVKSGIKIYQLHAFCDCESCKNRYKFRAGMRNDATATTKDITKVDEVAEFLKNWKCNFNKEISTMYFKF